MSALPAFLVGALFVAVLGRLGVNQVWSFLATMPVLILAWCFFVGRLLDKWIRRAKQIPVARDYPVSERRTQGTFGRARTLRRRRIYPEAESLFLSPSIACSHLPITRIWFLFFGVW